MAGAGGTDGASASVEVYEFEVHATDAEDALYKWTCKLPVTEPLRIGRSKWAAVFNIPVDVVGFENADRILLDLEKTAPEAGLSKTGAVIYAVPLDEKWTEAGGIDSAGSKEGKTAAPASSDKDKVASKSEKDTKTTAKPVTAATNSKAKKTGTATATATATASSSSKRAADAPAGATSKKAKETPAPATPAANSGSVPGGSEKIIFQSVNPKRPGTNAYERYEKYKKATTPAEAIDMGAVKGDISNDW
eukprot:CAMPEP_0206477640 /NCGR_PEP_ID=MMETSP0324_2-20121206/35524_1 /ASSEMBLY_ACC=CAM_ASM_000836 /TAXON_ID=2866 /ORGANISM="Crypthecodinium cohnii, Strain Seligo" /LENGTH=248 /DNA_ID=CAMNT_0053953685 /DNA_START=162 /DNA_END=905 /DNA_ORIENTATION=+